MPTDCNNRLIIYIYSALVRFKGFWFLTAPRPGLPVNRTQPNVPTYIFLISHENSCRIM